MNIETIKTRKSVRTYDGKPIEPEKRKALEEYLATIKNPVNVPVELKLLDGEKDHLSSTVITGTDTWIGGKVSLVPDAEMAYGYSLENALLYAASLGLGTVWLAVTIDRPAFEKAMNVNDEEVMPAISPVGYAAKKRSTRESLMRKGLKSDKREDFSTLFFKDDFSQPLTEEEAGKWEVPLNCVRWAPSATNKQPWRLVVSEEGNVIHFYKKHTRKDDKGSSIDIQKVDIGIAMCHLEIAAKEQGLNGQFVKADPGLDHDADEEYMISYRLN